MVYNRSSSSKASSKRPVNTFANDGSFLEMFKKMQEQGAAASDKDKDGNIKSEPVSLESKESTTKRDPTPPDGVEKCDSKPGTSSKPLFVSKRRGGKFLATGKVKKLKLDQEEEAQPKDAWALYLAEVKKYKQTTCEEEGKTRPLVK